MSNYAHPDTLVDTDWALAHLDVPGVVFIEVDVDTYSYEEGHLPGAVGWDWTVDLCDNVQRDILSKDALERLLSASGITRADTIVLYGDNNNWFAAWAFWQLKLYGHPDVRILDGGRLLWLEKGLPLTDEPTRRDPTTYQIRDTDDTDRAMLADVMQAVNHTSHGLVDVRSPAEFTGTLLAPVGLPETCQRGGHVPGAVNFPWGLACNADGTFKSREELEKLFDERGIRADRPTIVYCRIGERSSHTWFVLKHLLGHPNVQNYDGSWTEWGNLVRAPIER